MKRVMVVAGEASGDLHAAELIRYLLRIKPETEVFGLGGQRLANVGMELFGDICELAIIGVWDVVGKPNLFVSLFLRLRNVMRERRPDLLILVDFPDFNLLMARAARRLGIPVFYYISPQIWAWRPGRVKKIASLVNRIAVVFPFEVPLYERAGLKADFVGHPLLDVVKASRTRDNTLALYGLDPEKRTVALLPGSRRKELGFHLHPLLEAGKIMEEKGCQLILPVADTLNSTEIEAAIALTSASARVVRGDVYNVLEAADVVLVASGTATLESAIMAKPMVIIYKLGALNYWIARRLIRLPSIGLVNIVAGERVVPELIQRDVEGEKIASHALKILSNDIYRREMVCNLERVRNMLGSRGASERAARIASEFLN